MTIGNQGTVVEVTHEKMGANNANLSIGGVADHELLYILVLDARHADAADERWIDRL